MWFQNKMLTCVVALVNTPGFYSNALDKVAFYFLYGQPVLPAPFLKSSYFSHNDLKYILS